MMAPEAEQTRSIHQSPKSGRPNGVSPPMSSQNPRRRGRHRSHSSTDSSQSSDSYDSYTSSSRSPSPSRRRSRLHRHHSPTPTRRRRVHSRLRSRSRSRSFSRSHSSHSRSYSSLGSRSRSHSRSRSPSHSRSTYSSRSFSPNGLQRSPTHLSRSKHRKDYRRRSSSQSNSPSWRVRRRRRSRSPIESGYPAWRGEREYDRRRRRPWRVGGGGLRGRERGPKRKLSPPPLSRLMSTVFVTQLAQRVRRTDVLDLFSRAGRVHDVRLVMDRHTGRHKGAAYVEFYDRDALAAAVRLGGSILCGFPVEVKAWDDGGREDWHASQHDKSRVAKMDVAAGGSVADVGWSSRPPKWRTDGGFDGHRDDLNSGIPSSHTASATNVDSQLVSIAELKALLNPRNLPVNPVTRRASGVSPFVPVSTTPSGSLQTPPNLERVPLPVAAGAEAATIVYVGGFLETTTNEELRNTFKEFGEVVSCDVERGTNGRGSYVRMVEFADSNSANRALNFDGRYVQGRPIQVSLRRNDISGHVDVAGELDEGGDSGVNLNVSRRVMLMQQLSRGEPVNARRLRGDMEKLKPLDVPSLSIMLTNMFDPATEKDGFEQDVAEDVRDECATQYGKVVHVNVEKESHGVVYIRFEKVENSMKARHALNGRWFGGKKIIAVFVSDAEYLEKFPSAKISTET